MSEQADFVSKDPSNIYPNMLWAYRSMYEFELGWKDWASASPKTKSLEENATFTGAGMSRASHVAVPLELSLRQRKLLRVFWSSETVGVLGDDLLRNLGTCRRPMLITTSSSTTHTFENSSYCVCVVL
ncbi:hypothetical protein Scep_000609 [Stephania cephalantha]|uniref:Uncharacterized protein n=1 Tax=Stephania cephalantha TaxID=152367 RepID=A0AAP0L6G1_9MAGN